MKNRRVFKVLFGLLILSFGIFNIVGAAGLVPCEGPNCKFCDLLTLGQRVINFMLYGLVFPISAVMVVIGGGYILTAGGSESRVSKGKEIITAAVVGLLIALCSWLIIDTVIRVTGSNFTWYEVGNKVGCLN